MTDYIQCIRSKVGHERILLNFAAACIANDKGEILLQDRAASKDAWGFPGGALELGESADKAVIREVREETGLDVGVEALIGVYTKYFGEYTNWDRAQTIVFFFKCSIVGGSLRVDQNETFDLGFFDPHDAPHLFNEQHRDMLTDYI